MIQIRTVPVYVYIDIFDKFIQIQSLVRWFYPSNKIYTICHSLQIDRNVPSHGELYKNKKGHTKQLPFVKRCHLN